MKRFQAISLLFLLLSIAACGDDSDPEPASDVAGVIKIGVAVSETGKYAREGKDTSQGYNTWLDWVNDEKGGIMVGDARYKVEIVYYDDESDSATVANLVEKLITEDKVRFLLGPYSSGLTESASAISEEHGIIMVEGNGASESLFERGFQNLFAVLTPAGNYTQSALQMLAEKGAKSVVIAYEDTTFPTSMRRMQACSSSPPSGQRSRWHGPQGSSTRRSSWLLS